MEQKKVKPRVSVLLLKGNKVLVIRQEHDGETYWVLPGGGINHKETIKEAGIRETREETGLNIHIKKLIYVRDYIPENWTEQIVDIYLLGEITGGHLKIGSDPDRGKQIIKDIMLIDVTKLDTINFFPRYFIKHLPDDIKNNFRCNPVYIGKCP